MDTQLTGRRALLAISFASFVLLGLVADGMLGTAWPAIRDDFSRSLDDLGILVVAGVAGYTVGTASSGWIAGFGSHRLRFIMPTAITLAAVIGFAAAPSFWLLAVANSVAGLGLGLLDAGVNTHFAVNHDARAMHLLHASFGVGTTIGPVLVVATGSQWRAAYGLAALLQLLLLVAFTMARSESTPRAATTPVATATPRRAALAMIALFFVYTGVEVTAGQWAFSVLIEVMDDTAAGAWVSAYWGGLMVGRFVFGFVGNRVPSRFILEVGSIVALVGFGVVAIGVGPWGLPLAGLGLSGIFPALVLVTPDQAGRSGSDHAIGRQFAAASLGAAFLPAAIGVWAEQSGLGIVMPALLGLSSLLIWLVFHVRRTTVA